MSPNIALPSHPALPAILDPAGPYSQPVSVLTWVLLIGGFVIFAIVVAALLLALFGSPKLKSRLGGEKAIWLGGFAFPVVVLTILLIWGLSLASSLSASRMTGDEMRVKITGEMWWWRVHYLDENGREWLRDANELHIEVGKPVLLDLEAADVIHSFWVPRLSGKMDMIPGRTNRLLIQADKAGIYKGQCAEYCGGPHALMGFIVVAHEPQDFARWKAQRQGFRGSITAAPVAAADMGLALFQSKGCAACHNIAGTPANGLAGPDLSYVGARQSLGAGILPNNIGTMSGWIADSQSIKPANRMPNYHQLSGDELHNLAEYLVSLK